MFKKVCIYLKKYSKLIISSKDTPHRIALGVAIGLFAGVVIPLGQLILAIILAFVFRANKVFAGAATFITNPYTTPILYPGLCYLGSKVTGENLTISEINKFAHDMWHSFCWQRLADMGFNLLLSYIIGGCILGLILAVPGYIITYRVLLLNKKRKEKKRKSNFEKLEK